jgi:hypothetical protein
MRLSYGRCWSVLPIVLVSLTAGCSGSGDVLRVTGTVRAAGKPLPGLIVNFAPEHGRPSWGSTDEQGTYRLKYDKKTEGALRGRHKVSFAYRPRSPGEEPGAAMSPELRRVLDKYSSSATPLEVDVTKDGQIIDLELD